MNLSIKAIIFDFDGVILDDATIKEEAFENFFPSKFDDVVKPILNEHMKKGRKIVIRECIRAIKQSYQQELDYDFYLRKYSLLTKEKILNCSEIKGASHALNVLSKKYLLFILTATPDEEIDDIIEKRGLNQFREVIGSNNGTKVELAQKLFEKYDFKPDEVVYVGDGSNDLDCARKLGFEFIGICNQTNDFEERDDIKYKERDLQNIVSIIEKLTS